MRSARGRLIFGAGRFVGRSARARARRADGDVPGSGRKRDGFCVRDVRKAAGAGSRAANAVVKTVSSLARPDGLSSQAVCALGVRWRGPSRGGFGVFPSWRRRFAWRFCSSAAASRVDVVFGAFGFGGGLVAAAWPWARHEESGRLLARMARGVLRAFPGIVRFRCGRRAHRGGNARGPVDPRWRRRPCSRSLSLSISDSLATRAKSRGGERFVLAMFTGFATSDPPSSALPSSARRAGRSSPRRRG